MVESGLIDKYSHALDWERAVYDTIMLDNAVRVAKRFAADRNDTLIIVVADHAHPVGIIGTYDDARPGERLRDKLGIYAEAKFPNYPKAGADGYPQSIDVSRAPGFSCSPVSPTIALRASETSTARSSDGRERQKAVATRSTARRKRRDARQSASQHAGVHAADDVVLTAMGLERSFQGRIDNTAYSAGWRPRSDWEQGGQATSEHDAGAEVIALAGSHAFRRARVAIYVRSFARIEGRIDANLVRGAIFPRPFPPPAAWPCRRSPSRICPRPIAWPNGSPV
jgi:hypothetical protein